MKKENMMHTFQRLFSIIVSSAILLVACEEPDNPEGETLGSEQEVFEAIINTLTREYSCFEEMSMREWKALYEPALDEYRVSQDLPLAFYHLLERWQNVDVHLDYVAQSIRWSQYLMPPNEDFFYVAADKSNGLYYFTRFERSRDIHLKTLKVEESLSEYLYVCITGWYYMPKVDLAFLERYMQNHDYAGVVVDLRGDYGESILPSFVESILSCFYPIGHHEIYKKYGRLLPSYLNSYTASQSVSVEGNALLAGKPVAVLVNSMTTNERNILAYLLSSLTNSVVIGRTSSGGGGGYRYRKRYKFDNTIYDLYYPKVAVRNKQYETFAKPLNLDIQVFTDFDKSTVPAIDDCIIEAINYIQHTNH